MENIFSVYMLLVYSSALVPLLVAFHLWRKPATPGTRPAVIICLVMAFITLTNALEISATNLAVKLFWSNACFTGVAILPAGWLVLVLQYTGRRCTRPGLLLLSLEPLVFVTLVWTNPWHQLAWDGVQVISNNPAATIVLDYNPIFGLHVVYSYALIIAGGWLIVWTYWRAQRQYRRQAALLLAAALLPVISDLMYVMNWGPLAQISLLPFAFAISSLMLAWGFRSLWLFDVVPIARNIVIDEIGEAVIVLDELGRVLDLNPAAAALIEKPVKDCLGKPAASVFASWDELLQLAAGEQTRPLHGLEEREIVYGHGEVRRYFEARISLLTGLRGQIILLADTTTRRKTQEAALANEKILRRQLQEFRVLHAVALACVDAASEDELLERVTGIVGETLYTDNFGVLLLDEATRLLKFHHSYRGIAGPIDNLTIFLGEGINGMVAASGLPFRSGDVNQVSQYKTIYTKSTSELCVPMKVGERVIGTFNVESFQTEAFSEDDERLLVIIAGQVASSLERLRAQAAERQRVDELLAITRVGSKISAMLDQQQVLDSIVRNAAEFARVDASGLFFYRPDQRFYLAAAYGMGAEFCAIASREGVPLEGTAVGRSTRLRRPVQISDVLQDADYQARALAEMEKVRAILALPMLKGDDVIGGIVLWHRQPRQFTPQQELFMQALAHQSVNAVENARLFEMERERRQTAEALREIGTQLSATLDVDTVLAHLLEMVERLVPYDDANVMLVETGIARIVWSRGSEPYFQDMQNEIQGMQFVIDQTPNLKALVTIRQPFSIPDIRAYPGWLEGGVTRHVRSWAGVPIVVKDEIVAIFSLDKKEPNFYRLEHLERLAVFAGQAGLALQNALLLKETRQRLQEVTLLSKVITLTSTAETLPIALDQVCLEVAHFFGAPQVAFALVNPEDDFLQVVSEYCEPGRPSGLDERIPLNDNPSMQYVLEHQVPLAIYDAQSNPLLAPVHDLMCRRGTVSLVIVPVFQDKQVVGTLGIDHLEKRVYSQADLALLSNITNQMGQVLQRMDLFSEARQHAENMACLATVSAELNRTFTLNEMLTAIGRGAMALGKANRGAIFTWDGRGSYISPWYSGVSSWYVQQITAHYNQVPGGRLLEQNVPVLIPDVLALPEEALVHQLAQVENYRGLAIWPLVYEKQPAAGVVCYYDSPRFWAGEEKEVMLAFTRQATAALQNARLFDETRRQARQVQQLMDAVPEGVLLLDAQNMVELANPAARHFLADLAPGWDGQQPIANLGNLPLDRLLHPPQGKAWQEVKIPGMIARIFDISTQPLESQAEKASWLLVLRDVTQEYENQRRVQMQERLATVGQLAAGIAHDFNNIMAAIVVYADLLASDPNLAPTSRDRLAIIQQQVQRATSLIRQILDFSRRSVIEQINLDLLPFLKELDKLLARVLPETIRVDLSYKPGSYTVRADPTRLQQVFMNLALNARDAMLQGGRLRFSLARVHLDVESLLPLMDLTPGDWVRIEVTDTGSGIPQDDLPHIFDPFYTTKPIGQGTGLGLAQVYGIIKQHGGSLDVASKVGEGSTFIMYLPAVPAAPEEDLIQGDLPAILGRGETVLLVEDDWAARSAMQALLESQQYRVLIAENGLQALTLYEQMPAEIALVVSDVVMPEMGGVPLFHALKKISPQIKMLFVTGHPLDDENQAILEEGQVHWLQKPFSVQQFNQALKQLLPPA